LCESLRPFATAQASPPSGTNEDVLVREVAGLREEVTPVPVADVRVCPRKQAPSWRLPHAIRDEPNGRRKNRRQSDDFVARPRELISHGRVLTTPFTYEGPQRPCWKASGNEDRSARWRDGSLKSVAHLLNAHERDDPRWLGAAGLPSDCDCNRPGIVGRAFVCDVADALEDLVQGQVPWSGVTVS